MFDGVRSGITARGLPDWSRRREENKKIIRRWSQIKASGEFELQLRTCDLLDQGLQKCQDFLVFAFVSIITKHFFLQNLKSFGTIARNH